MVALSGPTSRQAGTPLLDPSAPTRSRGDRLPWARTGLDLSGTRTIWAVWDLGSGRFQPYRWADWEIATQRGTGPWPRSHGEWGHPPTAPIAAAKAAPEAAKSRRGSPYLPPSLCPCPRPPSHSGSERSGTVPRSPGWSWHPFLVPIGALWTLRPLTQAEEQHPHGQDGRRAAPHVSAGGWCGSPQPRPGSGARSMPWAHDQCGADDGGGGGGGRGRGRDVRALSG